ncbi:Monofunctional C1-tetrahydrofolate synthase [Trichinella pseudospiralis]
MEVTIRTAILIAFNYSSSDTRFVCVFVERGAFSATKCYLYSASLYSAVQSFFLYSFVSTSTLLFIWAVIVDEEFSFEVRNVDQISSPHGVGRYGSISIEWKGNVFALAKDEAQKVFSSRLVYMLIVRFQFK